ncbi:DUF4124 domain-containing protein [Ottowia caeni]|uniref:DUF4124 domain-containing protein n=1 Tax=Ottowia caeni TaxID=2870339 RepID=UPI003D7629A5
MVVPAHAQTHKCQGPNGRIIYSDAPCASNQTGSEIRLRENTIDTRKDWERNERYLQQRQQEEAEKAGGARPLPSPEYANQDRAQSPECAAAIRSANTQPSNASPQKIDADRGSARQVCGFDPWPGPSMTQIDTENRRSRALEAAAQARMNPIITSCDAGGCWDTNGIRYNGTNGRYFRAGDDTFCTRVGKTLNCGAR